MADAMTVTARPVRAARWKRELDHYPRGGVRYTSLTIVVLATVVLYYQFYLAGAVATSIITDYHMSFVYYVNISVVGYVLGAVASFLAGVADRYGRANIITVGLFVVGLLCLFGIPLADSKLTFGIVFVAIGFVEGVILVATPALIRDFSPQLGRASAMGFWTLGPVLGSLVVSIQVSSTSDTTPWKDHYTAAGIVGIVIALASALLLRELAPALRDQLMVSARDRALVEARARGVDVAASLRQPFRQMLKPDIIGSAFAISVFLIIYYTAVGFFPIYFETIFGFSQSSANALGNWNWAFNAIGLLVVGVVSDLTRVRKPFMVVGAVAAVVLTIVFLTRATHPETTYGTFVVLLVFLSLSLGCAYAPWMASFTETVERRNPALTATGLAVWGLVIRLVIAIAVFIVPHVVTTVTTLVDKGATVSALAAGEDPSLTATQNATVKAVAADPTIVTRAQQLAARYQAELATAAKLDPATQRALAATPDDPQTLAAALSQVSGVATADVATVLGAQAAHGPALQAAAALTPATAAALRATPSDPAVLARAVSEIATGLSVTPAEATARLRDLATVPPATLATVAADGPAVKTAGDRLTALAAVPAADLTFLATYGPALQDPATQQALRYLQANAPGVQAAAEESPRQWQHYFWIAVGGEVLFLPLVWLMAGYWRPRTARRAAAEHEAKVEAELAALTAERPATSTVSTAGT